MIMKNRNYRKRTPGEKHSGVIASFTMTCVSGREPYPVTLLDHEEWHPKTRIKRLSECKGDES